MAIKQLSDGNTSGVLLGQSATDKVGFYGLTTPIAQPVLTAPNTATFTTTMAETHIARITAALVALNLVRTT